MSSQGVAVGQIVGVVIAGVIGPIVILALAVVLLRRWYTVHRKAPSEGVKPDSRDPDIFTVVPFTAGRSALHMETRRRGSFFIL